MTTTAQTIAMEHSNVMTGELATRRAKAQSYFDRYPERKGQGPYVPSATLVTPVRGSSLKQATTTTSTAAAAAAANVTSNASLRNDTRRGEDVRAKEVNRQAKLRHGSDDVLIKQWHSRGDGESTRTSFSSTSEEERKIVGRSPRRMTVMLDEGERTVDKTSSAALSKGQPSRTNGNGLTTQTFAALETYRAKTAAAAAARATPSRYAERAQKLQEQPLQHSSETSERPRNISVTTIADQPNGGEHLTRKAERYTEARSDSAVPITTTQDLTKFERERQNAGKKITPSTLQTRLNRSLETDEKVLSIDEIIRRHSPSASSPCARPFDAYSSPSLRKAHDCIGLTSTNRPSTSSAGLPSIVYVDEQNEDDEANDSDASSINSVEREVRQTLNVHTPQRRQTYATKSPALQAAFTGHQDEGLRPVPSFVRQSEHMTPSLSAPALLHKKSTPTIIFASRKSASSRGHQKSDSLSIGIGTSGVRSVSSSATGGAPSHYDIGSSPTPPSRTMLRSKSNANLGSNKTTQMTLERRSKSTLRASSSSHPIPPLPSSSSSLTKTVPPPQPSSPGLTNEELDPIRKFVQSSKLTRLITLRRPPYAGKTVSLADVGDPDGKVVFLFLGLGAVRYLAGLYDDMATALGLRMICIDRWGMGKTDDLPADRRGVLEWSSVVAEVADRLSIQRFSLLAHSAGAPYAMATCLMLSHRVAGPVHLLAPWVSPTIESGYKWLRYIPDGIIRTAQAAEWRMQGWKLGVGGKSIGDTSADITGEVEGGKLAVQEGHESMDSVLSYAESSQASLMSSPLPYSSSTSYDTRVSPTSNGETGSSALPLRMSYVPAAADRDRGERNHGRKVSLRASLSSVAENNFDLLDSWQCRTTSDASVPSIPPPLPPKTPMKDRTPSFDTSPSSSSTAHTPSPLPVSSSTPSSSVDLPTELLRASHAESGGSANDLLVILGRSSQKPWGFSFVDVHHPVRVWHGEKDERVSLSSVLWMERELDDCRVNLIKGANHGLMTNVKVVVEALEHVAVHASE